MSKSDFEKELTDEQKTLLKLELDTLNGEWLRVLKPELTKPTFIKLKKFLESEKKEGKKIYPPENEIYSWSNFTPASKVKVVILGQDPYHGDGQAHGLCFSVKKGVRVPPSLVNIYTCVKNDYPDFKKPNHGYLENWAKEDAVINYLNEKKSGLVFMLWGSHAQKKGSKINKSVGTEVTTNFPAQDQPANAPFTLPLRNT
ncbi:uracil DNA glycosylase [Umbelopsis nana]